MNRNSWWLNESCTVGDWAQRAIMTVLTDHDLCCWLADCTRPMDSMHNDAVVGELLSTMRYEYSLHCESIALTWLFVCQDVLLYWFFNSLCTWLHLRVEQLLSTSWNTECLVHLQMASLSKQSISFHFWNSNKSLYILTIHVGLALGIATCREMWVQQTVYVTLWSPLRDSAWTCPVVRRESRCPRTAWWMADCLPTGVNAAVDAGHTSPMFWLGGT